jgi:hypothetical protein
MFRLRIDTKNAAFEGRTLAELARLLREAAQDLERGYRGGTLRDLNGNTVGRFELS